MALWRLNFAVKVAKFLSLYPFDLRQNLFGGDDDPYSHSQNRFALSGPKE